MCLWENENIKKVFPSQQSIYKYLSLLVIPQIGVPVYHSYLICYSPCYLWSYYIEKAQFNHPLSYHLSLCNRYLDPVIFGDYPLSVKQMVGSRLPIFTRQESNEIRGSFDFIGMNHYITLYVMDNSTWIPSSKSEEELPDSPEVPDTFAVTTSNSLSKHRTFVIST